LPNDRPFFVFSVQAGLLFYLKALSSFIGPPQRWNTDLLQRRYAMTTRNAVGPEHRPPPGFTRK